MSHVVALAEELHFGRAADRVHLSVSAFSRSIQAAEAELRVRIFDRHPGMLHITPAGRFLIERAQRLLLDARSLKREMDLYRSSQLGDIAFGVGPMASFTFMPRVLTELHQRYPGVNLKVEQTNSAQLLKRLLAEKIEFFVADIHALPNDAPVMMRVLLNSRLYLFVRLGHPLAAGTCTIQEVWKNGICSVKLTSTTRRLLAKLLSIDREQDFRLAIECDDFSLLRSVILSTDIALISSKAALQLDLEAKRVVQLDVPDMLELSAAFAVVSLRDRTSSPMAENAIAFLERIAAELDCP